MKTEQELRSMHSVATKIVHTARGGLREARPHVVEQKSRGHFESLKTNDELLRRSGRRERERIFGEQRAMQWLANRKQR